MKKIFVMAMAAALLCGCEKDLISDAAGDGEEVSVEVQKTKKFTFTVKGDFGCPTFSCPE